MNSNTFFKFILVLLLSTLFVACGGGGATSSENDEGSFGDSNENPGTGGNGEIPKNFVGQFSCEESVPFGRGTVTFKGGSHGDISVSCDVDTEKYSLSGVSHTISDARVVRATIEESSSGKTVSIIDIDYKTRDDFGEVKYYISNSETNEVVSCKATFRSPLPLTISTDEEISKFIDPIQDLPLMLSSDCPTNMPSSDLSSEVNHELSISENAEIYLDADLAIPSRTTWTYELK